jgi:hypothetical protein
MDESAPPVSPRATGRAGGRAGGPSRPEPSPWRLVGLGGQLLVALWAGVSGGVWLDRRFGTGPWGMVGGVVFAGLVFARLVRPFLRDDAGDAPPSVPPAAGP